MAAVQLTVEIVSLVVDSGAPKRIGNKNNIQARLNAIIRNQIRLFFMFMIFLS